MFINLSNHPSSGWLSEQTAAAQRYGKIVDLPFPPIDPRMSGEELEEEVERYYALVMELIKAGGDGSTSTRVMLQGEMTFTFRLVTRLKKAGIPCVAACSERMTEDVAAEDGKIQKKVTFVFAGFREY